MRNTNLRQFFIDVLIFVLLCGITFFVVYIKSKNPIASEAREAEHEAGYEEGYEFGYVEGFSEGYEAALFDYGIED